MSYPGGCDDHILVVHNFSSTTVHFCYHFPTPSLVNQINFTIYPTEHASDITQRPLYDTSLRTLIGTLPLRADDRGGTSHSDPITTVIQALRPNVLLRSPPVRVNIPPLATSFSGTWTPPLHGPHYDTVMSPPFNVRSLDGH